MSKATKAQALGILTVMYLGDADFEVVGGKETQQRTWDVIIRENWFNEEQNAVTAEGMVAADIPLFQQPCRRLTRPTTYSHPYKREGKVHHQTMTFPVGTVIELTFRTDPKTTPRRERWIEGFIAVNGGYDKLFVRMLEPMRMEEFIRDKPFSDKMVADGRLRKIDNEEKS